MFNPSRDDARKFFIESWRKHCANLPATQMEMLVASLIDIHPEYHPIFSGDTNEALSREWTPDEGESNPFLHLSLHLAIEEQLSIDQPPGIRSAFEKLLIHHGERHAALHDVLDCLAEIIWHAQRNQTPPDNTAYLDAIRRRIG